MEIDFLYGWKFPENKMLEIEKNHKKSHGG